MFLNCCDAAWNLVLVQLNCHLSCRQTHCQHCDTGLLTAKLTYPISSYISVSQTAVSLQMMEGNLCKQHVSAIVNPTNEKLAPTGRVSQCIAEAVGSFWLQRSCKELLRSKCPGQKALELGKAEITCCNGHGLRTSFEYIIHALGPHYSSAYPPLVAPTLCSM